MAIGLRGSLGSNNGVGGTTITMTLPSGVANNDVLIMHITVVGGTGTTITTPTGWTLLTSMTVNSTTALQQTMFWRLASSEPASYAVTITSNKASGTISAFFNANTSLPGTTQYAAQVNASSSTVAANQLGTFTSNNGIDVFLGGIAVGTTTNVPNLYTAGGSSSSTGGAATSQTTSGMGWRALSAVTTVGFIAGTYGAAAVNIAHHIFIFEVAGGGTNPVSKLGLLGVG